MVGFLSHTGYSHGGNGFEGMAFLLERFRGLELKDPSDPGHGLDLKAMATAFAKSYQAEKRAAKEAGTELRALPGVHHPVFKGNPVNHDPRERFIAEAMAERGEYLYGRMIGAAAEIDDHLNRGRNMDTPHARGTMRARRLAARCKPWTCRLIS